MSEDVDIEKLRTVLSFVRMKNEIVRKVKF